MFLESKELIGKYVGIKGNLLTASEFYNEKILEILELLDNDNFNEDEKRKFIGKLRRMKSESFDVFYPLIDKLLGLSKEEMEEEINNISEKLDLYVKRNSKIFSVDLVIDYINELNSKKDHYSIYAFSHMNGKLEKEELLLLSEEIDNRDEELIEKLSAPYRNWCDKVKDNKELYDMLKEQEYLVPQRVLLIVNYTLLRINEREERELRKYQIDKKVALEKAKRVNTNFHRRGFETLK